MNIQQLKAILEVFRTGSVSQAAKNLFISQSSVSTYISSLEKELGFPIFLRTRLGMEPTDQGYPVLEHAERICESYQLMLQGDRPARKRIRIGCGNYAPLGNAFVKLANETQGCSDAALSMINCSAAEIIEKISHFELDLGVLMVHTPVITAKESILRKKGLSWRVGKAIPTVIYISSAHKLYSKPDLHISDFSEEVILDSPNCEVVHSSFLNEFLHIRSDRALLTGDPRIRQQLITQGVAYSIGSKLPAALEEQYGYRTVPVEGVFSKPIIITNPLRPLHPLIRRYLELLDEGLQTV